jgi:type II secretory ATPase GspE/PulE/Tfp pilus assembly ATPase PilB-like protein
VAQRLVRVICTKCKAPIEPDLEGRKRLESVGLSLDEFPGGKVMIGKGCDFCFNSGYVDRTALYEMLPIDEPVRVRIMDKDGTSATVIKREAIERGTLRTLRRDGLNKVRAGVTTVDEVLRVTQKDE